LARKFTPFQIARVLILFSAGKFSLFSDTIQIAWVDYIALKGF